MGDYDSIKAEYKSVSIEELLRSAGLNDDGLIQTFHTQNVLRRIQRYMPFESGALIKLTILQTDIRKPVIITRAPQAHYLYRGKLYVDPETKSAWSRKDVVKVETKRDLTYNKKKNERAGSEWDKRLMEYEGEAITADLQRYIDEQARRNG